MYECEECGWRGHYRELEKQDIKGRPGELELQCPKCNSPKLKEIGGKGSRVTLSPAPCPC